MTRPVSIRLHWLALLALSTACGDDDASASSNSGTDSESETGASSSGEPTTITTADSSGGASSDSTGSQCGNGVIDDGEACDGSEFGGNTCENQGFLGGALMCSPDCLGFMTDGCQGAICGNGTIELDELCDGDDVGDGTCEAEGFVGGTLGCNATCDGYDTANCSSCGDSVVDDGEDCDGTELGDATCVSLGYDEGTLACATTCVYDESGCIAYSCGDGDITGETEECDGADLGKANCVGAGFGDGEVTCTDRCLLDFTACCGDGTLGGAEVCDGSDFGGLTCADQGAFDGGNLGCAATCDGIDISGCTLCGDDSAQGTEACDGADLAGNDCTTVPGGFVGGTLTCANDCGFDTSGCNFCGNDVLDAGEECDGAAAANTDCIGLGHTGGVLTCTDACTTDDSTCTDFPVPSAGDVVITEIMRDPTAVADPSGEWFELHNPSATESYQLINCQVSDDGSDSFVIDLDLVIGPGQYLSFARSLGPGFSPDFVYDNMSLGNGDDELELFCGAASVDRVAWTDAEFPDVAGASMQVDPSSTAAVANDDGANWCAGTSQYFMGDLGTPGLPNDTCTPPTYTVDFCNLQFPVAITDLEGAQVDVYGRLYVAGLTDQSSVNNPAVNVIGYVGYGPDGSDPATDATWVWTAATPNAGWVGVGDPDVNNDEYVATMSLPLPGSYDYAFRFTGDGGTTFTYCDGGAGSSDGYAAVDAGQMTTTPAGDADVLFFSEYYEGTSNNKAVEIYNPSAQSVNLAACSVLLYANGGAVPTTLPLSGLVLPGDAFVVCHGSFVQQALCDTTASLNYNGNDALALSCDGTTLDVIGQVGFNPGIEWSGGGTGTLDEDLRRNCNVTAGDPNGADAFDPSVEWTGLPILAANMQPENVDDLGVHCD